MKKTEKIPVVNPYACGIDVGSKAHYVAVGQGKEEVRSFGVYTEDYRKMISYLNQEKVKTIAMESTGNYWQTLFMALREAGFEVLLVCGSQTKNVKGRKTDVQDCQWIQWLHSVGMLTGSFIPNELVSELRIYSRQRQKYIQYQNRLINQLQRDLRLMNIRLEVALNDITGKSGLTIIEAILAGKRDPHDLASLADYRVKKSKEEIAKSLEGNWSDPILFILNQHYHEYLQTRTRIQECENQIERKLQIFLLTSEIDPSKAPEHKKSLKKNKNTPMLDLQKMGFQYFGGVDLFAIEGVNKSTVLSLITEIGTDIDKFPNSKAFSNWLHLCPNQKITGGKIISNRTKKGANPLSQALKSCANSIGSQKRGYLNHFFNRIAFKKGRKEAITATAHKLAVIIYNMLTKYQPYRPYDLEKHLAKSRESKLKQINKMIENYQIQAGELSYNCL